MSVKSWHDSDDVDSDMECELYDMLYCDMEKKNNKADEIYNSTQDIETLFIKKDESKIELKKAEKKLEESIIVISDSDDSSVAKKVYCSNKISSLYVGASSDDDSDYDHINANLISPENSSLILNITNNSTSSFQKPQPKRFDDWSVDPVRFEPRSRNHNRYYDIKNNSVCEKCLKKGHPESECTRSGPVCILCGNEGHISNECTDLICHICFQTDHLAKKCPFTNKFLKEGCRRCGQRGHSEQICPDIWRQYKYTLTPGQPPVVQTCSSQNKSRVFCANCSRIGHFTDQCPRNRMSSKFLGPAPIMEIIRFDKTDIYKTAGLSYVTSPECDFENMISENFEEIDQHLVDMDVTAIIKDKCVTSKSISGNCANTSDSNVFEIENKSSGFGDGYIMLSPIVKANERKSLKPLNSSIIEFSTPSTSSKSKPPKKINGELIDSSMPILPEAVLRKLFPEETQNIEKLTPSIRTKLRKKLKKFLKNGYLPGDSEMTEDKMDFWLQEISTGKSLTYKAKKNLLDSVSAALHSISDRVSDVTTEGAVDSDDGLVDANGKRNIPDTRKKRNKAQRKIKSLKNELKRMQFKEGYVDLTGLYEEDSPPAKKRKKAANQKKTHKSKKNAKQSLPVASC